MRNLNLFGGLGVLREKCRLAQRASYERGEVTKGRRERRARSKILLKH